MTLNDLERLHTVKYHLAYIAVFRSSLYNDDIDHTVSLLVDQRKMIFL